MSSSKCKHSDIARDDNIWTCKSCGTVVKERVFGVSSNDESTIKKTTGKNVVRSKNFMMFRDTTPITELRDEAKALGVKYVNSLDKTSLRKAIQLRSGRKTSLTESYESKSLVELRKVAKAKGVKRINSYSKKELIEQLKK